MTGPVPAEANVMERLLAQVAALDDSASARPEPAARCPDPVRLRYALSLASRLRAAPPAVQAVLHAKLVQALKALGAPVDPDPTVPADGLTAVHQAGEVGEAPSVRPAPADGGGQSLARRKTRPNPPVAPPSVPLSPLGQLNQYLQSAAQEAAEAGAPHTAVKSGQPDLKSAVRFRETWARISAETEVDKATHRAPENAGPLNAHNLVLRTLGLMRDLSPDYLRRFLSHAETLLWLDQAYGQLKQPAAKGRGAKSGAPKK